MSEYVLTSLAQRDIFEIWAFIAEDSETAAGKVEESIFDACTFIAQNPQYGHLRPDLTSRQLRFWTIPRYPNYSLVYRPDTSPVQVIAVLHGKRHLQRVIRQRS